MYPVTVSSWDLWTLYHKVTFDGANRIIYVNDGVTELNIKTDVYSDWKEWAQAMPDNATWLPAIRTIGGDPTLEGQTAGDIYFLQNGWKLYIDLTKVRVSGILFSDDFDSPYYDYSGNIQYPAQVSSLVSGFERVRVPAIEDIWAYNSRTLTQQIASDAPTVEEISQAVWSYITRSLTEGAGTSPQEIWEYNNRTLTTDAAPSVEEIWSAPSRTLTENPGPTAAEIADSVWDESYVDHDTDGTMGHLLNYSKQLQKSIWVNTELTNGDGSQENPYNNIQDAVDRAENDNIRTIYLIGDVTLTKNFKNFYLVGIGVPEVNLNGQDIRNSHFTEVALKGSFVNGSNIVIRDSLLLDGAYLDGFIENSALGGNLICNPNSVVFMKDCASAIPGTNRPTISMNPAATSQLSVRGYNGGLTIFDCNQSTDRVTVELAAGSLTFASSCTNGIMVARGVGKFVDETNGAAVFNETINQEMLDTLEALAANIQTTTNTINTNTDTVEASLASLTTTVNTINTNTDSVEAGIASVQASVNAINLNTDTVESGITALQSVVDGIAITASSTDGKVDSVLLGLAAVNTNTVDIENKIDTLSLKADAIDTNISNVDSMVDLVYTSVDTVESSLTSLHNKADTISTNVVNINGNTSNLETKLDYVTTTVNTINTNVDTILNTDTDVTVLENKIDAVALTVNTIDTNVSNVGSMVDLVYTNTDTVESSLTSLHNKVDTASVNIVTIDNNTSNLDSKLSLVSSNITAIGTTLTDVESMVDLVYTNTDTVESSLTSLHNKVDTVSTNITSIVGYTNNLQVTIEGVGLDTVENQALLNSLQTSLNLVSTDVTSINNTVTNINSTTQSTNTEVLSKLLEVWRILGLDSNNPQTITDVSISVGDITLSISQPDASTTEVSRQ